MPWGISLVHHVGFGFCVVPQQCLPVSSLAVINGFVCSVSERSLLSPYILRHCRDWGLLQHPSSRDLLLIGGHSAVGKVAQGMWAMVVLLSGAACF